MRGTTRAPEQTHRRWADRTTASASSWEVFEEIFEVLALELLRRSALDVRVTLPQYQSGEEEVCIRECSHDEWIAWRLHGKLPPGMILPPRPTNSWREQAEAMQAAAASSNDDEGPGG